MHLHAILRTQLAIAQEKFGPLNILETGTIRSTEPQYADDDGWSTVCFAEWVRDHGGRFETIDLETDAALEVLRGRGFAAIGGNSLRIELQHHVRVWRMHSVDFLGGRLFSEGSYASARIADPALPPSGIHLAFLDSDNDPTLILNEYLLVKQLMPSGAILMVDDVDLSPGAEAKKGLAIVPWLEKHGQEYTIAGRCGRGVATGVLITRIP